MNALEKYEFAVNFKVESFKNHPNYQEFRKAVNKNLLLRCGFGNSA